MSIPDPLSSAVLAATYGVPEKLPDVLDVLIVGGGPAGTSAAFRCHELGLVALVVEHDDLMRRIRDYSKEKLILPTFGGGDRQRFPVGEELLQGLRFDPIDKDEMCESWKQLYRSHQVPALLGIELTGLERQESGVHRVKTFDHTQRKERTFAARHVVIAIGRGVPRQFDIPGDVTGIAYRLTDAGAYVGEPCCVLGGGTSAAEAVIAISNAKATSGDLTPVCWSYRGDKMPRVSRSLAEVFFNAYVGNGNIQYHPRSEPAAIVTGDDRVEYLAVRVDRRCMLGRPQETTHLEFRKDFCVACIGEDLPEQLLAGLGIPMVVGGARAKKRIVVNGYLESCVSDVYLIGDLLSQAYLETDDFGAEPETFVEVKHRGNIKSSLRDGVLVAQVIAQRLRGEAEIDTSIAELEEEAVESLPIEVDAVASDGEAMAAGVESARSEPVLVRILPGGVTGEEFGLASPGVTTLGRTDCDIVFPSDTFLATPHASIVATEDGFHLRDDGSRTGVFLRLPVASHFPVGDGDLVRVGKQFLVFELSEEGAFLKHYDENGREVGQHVLPPKTIVLGRQAPDITLDENDRTLSRRQLAVSFEDGKLEIKDLKSANGSYLRVRSTVPIRHGQQFRIGQQTLVLSRSDAVVDVDGDVANVDEGAPAAPLSAPGRVSAESSTNNLRATFQPAGKSVIVQPGQTLCEAAEAAGLAISAECHSGICGSDPIRILEGSENLQPHHDQEAETLEDICELEPGACRLACMSRITGPVVVEILDP